MPQWLLHDESYAPPADKDAFVDRSIRSILGAVSRIRSRSVRRPDEARLNPGMKLASMLLLIALISLSRSFFFVMFSGALLLTLLSLQRAELILRVLKVVLPAAAFTFAILLPSAIWGNFPGVVTITVKVAVTVAAVGLFSATTDWGAITGALKIFLLPDLFILVLDATIRYIDLLGGLSLSMLHALKLRSVGRNRMKTASLSGIAGSLFLRSRAMAEEMHAAMECRCFTGRYRIGRAARVSPSDIWPLAADAAILFVFIASGA